ncbi:MAG: efflux RND transporter permease subunit [Balneolales bacterium]|nr:efflux RND transporter permease subunit [Balneolales bacterium]
MKSLLGYFIRYKSVSIFTLLLLVVMGSLVFSNLRYSFFPKESIDFINVDIFYTGASPEEVEEAAISKIEENLKGVSGIERFTSESKNNRGSIQIELLENADPDQVLVDVKNAVDQITTFPDLMDDPVVYKVEVLTDAMVLAVSGDQPLTVIKDVARGIENDLLNHPSISKVTISGYPEEEIEIAIREETLLAYDLTFADVTRAIRGENVELFGGTIKTGREEIQIKADARNYFAQDMAGIVVRTTPDGAVVRLGDIAELRNQFAEMPERRFLNGSRGVEIKVENTWDEDILETVGFLRNYVKEFNEGREDLKLIVISDQADALEERIQILADNAWQGALLVVIVLGIFLNFRLALWVSLQIPAALLGMIIFAGIWGITINQLSMFGVILVLGILVDYGVVVSENIYQQFEKGKDSINAAIDGTMELVEPLILSFTTTVAAFSFFFFLDGRLGEFFSDISFVVIASNIVALLCGFFLLPALIANSKSLRKGSKPNRLEAFFDRIFRKILKGFYAPSLRFGLRYPFVVIATVIALFIITIGGFRGGIIQTTFFPNIEFDQASVSLRLPAGTSDEVTEEILIELEEAARRVDERLTEQANGNSPILYIQRIVGPGTNTGSLQITLTKPEERDFLAFEIAGMIRDEAGDVPEAENISFGTADAFGKPISISMIHRYDDLDELREVKNRLAAKLAAEKTITDVIDNDEIGQRELVIDLLPAAVQLGFTLEMITAQVREGFFGTEVQSLQRGDEEVKVWLRYDRETRSSAFNLERMRINGPDGNRYMLKDLARLRETETVVTINRRDGRREISVEADVASLDIPVPAVIGMIQSRILPELREEFPFVEYTFEGQARQSADTARSAARAGPIVLLVMLFMILLNGRSVSQTVVSVLVLPFAIIGVSWGHVISGIPLSIFSMLGIIALIGILINNIFVLLSSFNEQLKNGHSFVRSIYSASLSRFKPIMLTAITTAAGLTPLLLGTSIGAQFLKPTGVAVFYGLLFGTFLTLALLPCLIVASNTVKRSVGSLISRRLLSREEVETARREMNRIALLEAEQK